MNNDVASYFQALEDLESSINEIYQNREGLNAGELAQQLIDFRNHRSNIIRTYFKDFFQVALKRSGVAKTLYKIKDECNRKRVFIPHDLEIHNNGAVFLVIHRARVVSQWGLISPDKFLNSLGFNHENLPEFHVMASCLGSVFLNSLINEHFFLTNILPKLLTEGTLLNYEGEVIVDSRKIAA